MGTWSHEPFGNDTANDWAYDLSEVRDLSHVEAALNRVLDVGAGYLEASVAEEAIAAVEVIAKLLGRGTQSDGYTEKVDDWVRRVKLKPTRTLCDKAKQALQRIESKDSEVLELWQEGDDGDEWKKALGQLRSALEV